MTNVTLLFNSITQWFYSNNNFLYNIMTIWLFWIQNSNHLVVISLFFSNRHILFPRDSPSIIGFSCLRLVEVVVVVTCCCCFCCGCCSRVLLCVYVWSSAVRLCQLLTTTDLYYVAQIKSVFSFDDPPTVTVIKR